MNLKNSPQTCKPAFMGTTGNWKSYSKYFINYCNHSISQSLSTQVRRSCIGWTDSCTDLNFPLFTAVRNSPSTTQVLAGKVHPDASGQGKKMTGRQTLLEKQETVEEAVNN